MKLTNLGEAMNIKKVSEKDKVGVFEIDGLYTGYGLTVGNALRRVLLSSLPGAAITQIKIKGVGHEFTTIPNVLEDVVDLMLNLKKIRLRLYVNEPQVLTLKSKGEKEVTAADIKTNTNVDVISKDTHIATLTSKGAELEMELTIERGLGYVPVESRKLEKLPVGVIALDAIFSPVVKANFTVENMRVGDRTDYNRLNIVVETDGSVTPSEAVKKSSDILQEHFLKISGVEVLESKPEVVEASEGKEKKSKKSKKE